ncbi:hypothetical protein AVEN_50968-1 [Araneus ventricosus]|uniref:Uncharacterized protein n=1 Tax=Araneus ventricosus TaxID=182803 RepID=A0A4Y2KMT0_ARAVE|nr:hypothetical protein AVEN_50968-1 [Araneus ventricosus]
MVHICLRTRHVFVKMTFECNYFNSVTKAWKTKTKRRPGGSHMEYQDMGNQSELPPLCLSNRINLNEGHHESNVETKSEVLIALPQEIHPSSEWG